MVIHAIWLELSKVCSCIELWLCFFECKHWLWLIRCIAEVVMEHILNLHGSLNKALSNFIFCKKWDMLSRWSFFLNSKDQFWPVLDILPPWVTYNKWRLLKIWILVLIISHGLVGRKENFHKLIYMLHFGCNPSLPAIQDKVSIWCIFMAISYFWSDNV